MISTFQAEVLASTLSVTASIHAVQTLEQPNDDPELFQHMVAVACKKSFLKQLHGLGYVKPNPHRKSSRDGANEHKPPEDLEAPAEPT